MGAKKRSNSKQQPIQKRATTEQHTAYHKAKISPENLFTTADIKQLFDISESTLSTELPRDCIAWQPTQFTRSRDFGSIAWHPNKN